MSKQILSTDFSKSSLQPLEIQVLTQYQLLAKQLITLNNEITKLTSSATDDITAETLLDNVRILEKKIGLVYTFFQGAVYHIYMKNEYDQSEKEEKTEETETEHKNEEVKPQDALTDS